MTGNYAQTGKSLIDWLKNLAQQEPAHPAGICDSYANCLIALGSGSNNIFRDGVVAEMYRMYVEYGENSANALKSYLAGQLDALTGKRYGVAHWSGIFAKDQAAGFLRFGENTRPREARQLTTLPVAELSRLGQKLTLSPSVESTPQEIMQARMRCVAAGGEWNNATQLCQYPAQAGGGGEEDYVGGEAPPAQGPLLDTGKNYRIVDPAYEASIINQLSQFWVTSSGQNPNGSTWYYLTAGGPPDPSAPISGAQVVRGKPDTIGVVVSLDVTNPELYKLLLTSSEIDATTESTAGQTAKSMNPEAVLYPPFDMAPFVLQVPAGGWTDEAPDPTGPFLPATREAKMKLAAISVGGLVVLAALGGGIYYLVKRSKKKRRAAVPNRRKRRRAVRRRPRRRTVRKRTARKRRTARRRRRR